uniref:Uncharacterized protein n=1 Tax=Arundo donax TaxID=35708 RepID=A0A0A9H1I4_ARUDO
MNCVPLRSEKDPVLICKTAAIYLHLFQSPPGSSKDPIVVPPEICICVAFVSFCCLFLHLLLVASIFGSSYYSSDLGQFLTPSHLLSQINYILF